ncbi:Coatomer subunit zeta-1 [Schistosoma japonicum]|uniref:Coatomer subunit zeta n=1 Tax=Schistosoma japonicum TaxID=6182 RepID=A0A4Z2DIC9_SCHJA|nr:Coatomer subunit zeta-1 [Schistosoma japonicum]
MLDIEFHSGTVEAVPTSDLRTHNAPAEITLLDGATCVYRNVGDLYFYVIGDAKENELLLVSALQCLYDSISQALKRSVEKKTLLDNLDLIFLIVDELCHNGILLESDATALVSRVGARTDDIPLGEQTVAQAIQNAKEQIRLSLIK